ncbi:MAG: TPM domain-containing protein, partial [Cyanobium sp.]
MLSSAMEMEVNAVLRRLDETTTVEVAVAVVNSIGYAVPGDFRTELFRYWEIGKAENDNGLLILLVMDQRCLEFEVGYGLEGILTDIMCKQIQEEYMVPLAKEGNIDGCVRAGVMQVYQILTEPAYRDEVYAYSLAYGQSLPLWRQPMSVVIMAIFGGIYLLSTIGGFRTRKKSLKKAPDYVKHQFNDSYVVSKFAMLNLGLPLGFYVWQELSGGIRVFEFWIFIYGLFMVLLLERRIRLNAYIRREHIGDAPQDVYGVMARSH